MVAVSALVGAISTGVPGSAASTTSGLAAAFEVEEITLGANGQLSSMTRTGLATLTNSVAGSSVKSDSVETQPAREISRQLEPMLTTGAVASGERVQVQVSFVEDQQIPLRRCVRSWRASSLRAAWGRRRRT